MAAWGPAWTYRFFGIITIVIGAVSTLSCYYYGPDSPIPFALPPRARLCSPTSSPNSQPGYLEDMLLTPNQPIAFLLRQGPITQSSPSLNSRGLSARPSKPIFKSSRFIRILVAVFIASYPFFIPPYFIPQYGTSVSPLLLRRQGCRAKIGGQSFLVRTGCS